MEKEEKGGNCYRMQELGVGEVKYQEAQRREDVHRNPGVLTKDK